MKEFQDYTGKPVFQVVNSEGLTVFYPYHIETINEYVKAKQEKYSKDNG